MLSKVVSAYMLRRGAQRFVTPALMASSNGLFRLTPQRFFIDKLGLNESSELATPEQLKAGEVQLWKEQQRREETGLVL
jgi:hypothetical protein